MYLTAIALLGLALLTAGAAAAEPVPPGAPPAAAVSSTGQRPARAPVTREAVVKPERDRRAYRYLELPNRLRVVLVSDPQADKGAAALDVAVGSRHDPEARPGLAHFLEHMLFLGTAKYPEPGEYQRFIQAHGGSQNASTSYEHTNYYFEVDDGHLAAALDRFAQFFVAPAFYEAYVERERHAVHSEYQARRKSDASRTWDATKQVFNPRHPASRFSVGSLETLSDDAGGAIRDALVEFWKAHYSANRMTLAVYGGHPLDALERWVVASFSAVEDRGLPPAGGAVAEPLFAPDRLPAVLFVEPERDTRRVTLSFPVPPVLAHYRAKPTHYLANLIGHEGEGSLLSALKAAGWSDGLSAGIGFTGRDAATLRIDIRLTAAGRREVASVVALVFRYIEAIREEGVARWRFEEQRRLLDIEFEFHEPASPVSYVVGLARALHHFPPSEVLRGPFLLDRFDRALIGDYLARLRPENVLVTIQAKGVKTAARSPHFDAPYRIAEVPPEWLEAWRPGGGGSGGLRPAAGAGGTGEGSGAPGGEPAPPGGDPAARLALPEPNAFIPESLALVEPEPERPVPRRLTSRPGMDLWFQADPSFGVPRANFFVSVRSPAAQSSARSAVLASLYVRLVHDQLQEATYPARLAGLGYELYTHVRGFTLRVSGYDDKLPLLLARLLGTLREPRVAPERFAAQKDEFGRDLANRSKDRSYTLAMREVAELVLDPYWTDAEQLAALETLTAGDLRAFVPRLLGAIDIAVLAHGNLTAAEARGLGARVVEELRARAEPVAVPRASVVKLPAGVRYARAVAVEHEDSAIADYFQGRSRLVIERARYALLHQILATPFYHELRTEQQLGYVVFATPVVYVDVPGIAFVIQSPGTPAPVMVERVHAFLDAYTGQLAAMSPAAFARHKEGLRSRLLERDQTLAERSERYWREIDRNRFTFDTDERIAGAVAGVEQAAFAAFYRRVLLGPARREIAVEAIGARHREGAGAAGAGDGPARSARTVRDVAAFKQGHPWYRAR